MKKIYVFLLITLSVNLYADLPHSVYINLTEEYLYENNEKVKLDIENTFFNNTIIEVLDALQIMNSSEANNEISISLYGEPISNEYNSGTKLYSGVKYSGNITYISEGHEALKKEIAAEKLPERTIVYWNKNAIPDKPEKAPFENVYIDQVLSQIIDFLCTAYGDDVVLKILESQNSKLIKSLILVDYIKTNAQVSRAITTTLINEIKEDWTNILDMSVYSYKESAHIDFVKLLCENNQKEILELFDYIHENGYKKKYDPNFLYYRLSLMTQEKDVQEHLVKFLGNDVFDLCNPSYFVDQSEFDDYYNKVIASFIENEASNDLVDSYKKSTVFFEKSFR